MAGSDTPGFICYIITLPSSHYTPKQKNNAYFSDLSSRQRFGCSTNRLGLTDAQSPESVSYFLCYNENEMHSCSCGGWTDMWPDPDFFNEQELSGELTAPNFCIWRKNRKEKKETFQVGNLKGNINHSRSFQFQTCLEGNFNTCQSETSHHSSFLLDCISHVHTLAIG